MDEEIARLLVRDRIVEARPSRIPLACVLLVFAALAVTVEVLLRLNSLPPGWVSTPGWVPTPGLIRGAALLLLGLLGWLQLGLMRGHLLVLVVSVHLAIALTIFPAYQILTSLAVGSTPREILALYPDGVTAVGASFGVVALLLSSRSLRWFFQARHWRRVLRTLPESIMSRSTNRAWITSALLLGLATTAAAADDLVGPLPIFPAEKKHNHASCVVELPNGDLLATWYSGSGERRSDDVLIQAARLPKGRTEWEPRFLLADTPGYPDCNPALFAAPDKTLWLIWPTILDHRWEGALLKFAVATEYPDGRGDPKWTREGVLHITPQGFAEAMARAIKDAGLVRHIVKPGELEEIEKRSQDLLYQRLGWMPRVHPIVLPSGRWVWPLYCDTFSCSIMAISDDQGKTWHASAPMIGYGNIQPSLVRKNDGSIVAFMRDNGPFRRIRLSTSKDDGETWSTVTSSELPNPGAGIEAIRLASGNWAIIYNDTERGRHSLAVSLSDDEGATWKWTRHLARTEPGDESFHYPSIIQGADGAIHATYTHGGTPQGSTIDYAKLTEEWIRQGDPARP